nr:TetR/AcrR family transcriptional regulator [Saprospiraceae bacterium]
MRESILSHARQVFFKRGVRSVTMDELCGQLGISKKTLYQHFANKEELIGEVVRGFMAENTQIIKELITGAPHAIEGFFNTSTHVYTIMSRISPVMVYEVKKYYPTIWEELQTFKRLSIQDMATENLRRGVEEGLYRRDIDVDLVMRFYLAILLNMNDEELFPETLVNPAKIYGTFIKYHIRSIATSKGYQLFLDLREKNNSSDTPSKQV